MSRQTRGNQSPSLGSDLAGAGVADRQVLDALLWRVRAGSPWSEVLSAMDYRRVAMTGSFAAEGQRLEPPSGLAHKISDSSRSALLGANGRPIALRLAGGNAHEACEAKALMEGHARRS